MIAILKGLVDAFLNHLPVNQQKKAEHLDKVLPKEEGPHKCDPENLYGWSVMEGRGSSSTGEARFKCRTCGNEMFLGGWGSENWLDPSIKRRYAPAE